MHYSTKILFLLILFYGCKDEPIDIPTIEESVSEVDDSAFISAVDISSFPEIELSNPQFYSTEGEEVDFLTSLADAGVNTIRLRLWVAPQNQHSSFEEVKLFSERLKGLGFKIWLTLHYSDTWADPSQQAMPERWQHLNLETLKDSIATYAEKVVKEIEPAYIQIGNEINNGLLYPYGRIQEEAFESIMNTAVTAIRSADPKVQIMIHYAGIEGAEWFYNKVQNVDYDIIALSYYPIWHGKSLLELQRTIEELGSQHSKSIVIAETAYPFTLEWNDWTHNIVGENGQLILPTYPATPAGQEAFVLAIKELMVEEEKGIGFCYWGAELIAWKGNTSSTASPWENQALFDFENRALPVLSAFNVE